ncbi:hypothetical protein GEMRC1_002910 [Eukaryota sp. GEM-RC1]
MSVGTSFALLRLKKKNINCISPTRINVAGITSYVFFDKTGTLTEEGLDVHSCYDSDLNQHFDLASRQIPTLLRASFGVAHSLSSDDDGRLLGDPLDATMVNAARWDIEEIVGDVSSVANPIICRPKYTFEEDFFVNNNLKGLSVLRRFDFSSSLQRMSVIAFDPQSRQFFSIIKGAPEAVVSLCLEDTIPKDLSSIIDGLSTQGKRVLAIGGRILGSMSVNRAYKASRSKIEKDFEFLGLIVFTNRVRHDSPTVIAELLAANIKTAMVTGDHIATGIAVSREVGIVPQASVALIVDTLKEKLVFSLNGAVESLSLFKNDETADVYASLKSRYPSFKQGIFTNEYDVIRFVDDVIKSTKMSKRQRKNLYKYKFCNNELTLGATGKGFRLLESGHACQDPCPSTKCKSNCLFCLWLSQCKVFGRMTPNDKADLMTYFGTLSSFVGDGCNDCGALRAAGVGVSLSEAEASIAAPFTSSEPSVACSVETMKQGRASLVTSIQAFKFMAMYSIIQFCSVLILYRIGSNLGDLQFLYIDMFLILPLAVTMARGSPSATLAKSKVPAALVSLRVMLSLFVHITVVIFSQIFMQYFLAQQDWYEPLTPDPGDHNIACQENTVGFLFSNLQYVTMALVLTTSKPHKKSNFTNISFVVFVIVVFSGGVFVVLKHSILSDYLELVPDIPFSFRVNILVFAGITALFGFIFERLVVERLAA